MSRQRSTARQVAPIVAAALAPFVIAAAFAGDGDGIQVTAALATTKAAPGEKVVVRFHVAVPQGLHLYPPGSTLGLPISASLAKDVKGLAQGELKPLAGERTIEVKGVGSGPILEGTFDVDWPLPL